MHLIRWLGPALTALSSILLAVSVWPSPRYADANFDCPKQIRLGEVDTVTVSIPPDLAGDTHRVAIANVQTVDLRITPPGDSLQSARPGHPLKWRWQVAAGDDPGRTELTIVIYLRSVDPQEGESTDQPIWARSLTITVTDVFGMPASTARSIALAGTAAGFGLSLLPFARTLLLRRRRQP